MMYYAARYISPWKSTRDTIIPPGTTLHDNLQGALLWFIDNPYDKMKKRVPVVLCVEIAPEPKPTDVYVRGWKRDALFNVSFRFRQRGGWLEGTKRILPTAEDFVCAVTERQMLDARNRAPGIAAVVVPPTEMKIVSTTPLPIGTPINLTRGIPHVDIAGSFIVVAKNENEYTIRSVS